MQNALTVYAVHCSSALLYALIGMDEEEAQLLGGPPPPTAAPAAAGTTKPISDT